MKIDAGIGWDLNSAGTQAEEFEDRGFSGIFSTETAHDPFFPLLVAAQHTSRIELMTSVAIAFGRSPMNLAQIGHDLNAASQGRFILGLGSQIHAHITRRFSMPWSKPAARMREYVQALKAIWACWYEQKPLEFKGEFYTHTLMNPLFTPTNIMYGAPKVFVAAVGPLMTEVAGEVADGLITHAFTTEKYIRETTFPALNRGFAKSGRQRAEFEISCLLFTVTGRNEDEFEQSKIATRRQIAFYGSTPAYKPVLESVGMGSLQTELLQLSKQGKWEEMGNLIDDDTLSAFAVIGEPNSLAEKILQRYGALVDRISVVCGEVPIECLTEFIATLTEGSATD